MKKVFISLLAAMLLISSLTACKPTLRAAIEEQAAVAAYNEFDLDTCFSEKEGYHFPTCEWGVDAKEFQARNYYPIQKAVAYGTNGEGIYSASLRAALLGRPNDEAQVAMNKDDYLYMVSYMFSSEGAEEAELSQSALYEQYLAVLTEKFGEPDEVTNNAVTEENVTTNYVTNCWNYTTEDVIETQLQFSKAYTLVGAEPLYISFGFVWVNGDPQDETE